MDATNLPLLKKPEAIKANQIKIPTPPAEVVDQPQELGKVQKSVKQVLEFLRKKVLWNERKSYILSGIQQNPTIQTDKSAMPDFTNTKLVMKTTPGPILKNRWQKAFRKICLIRAIEKQEALRARVKDIEENRIKTILDKLNPVEGVDFFVHTPQTFSVGEGRPRLLHEYFKNCDELHALNLRVKTINQV